MIDKLHIRFLGVPQIELNGETRMPQRRHTLALLAFLAATPGEHTRESVAALLWPESVHARRNLRNLLLDTKQHVSPYLILSSPEMLALNPHAYCFLDIERFRAVTSRLTSTSTTQPLSLDSVEAIRAAVSLYRGRFVENLYLEDSQLFGDWQLVQQGRFEQDAIALLQALSTHLGLHLDPHKCIQYLERWLQLDPMAEEAHLQLIRLYISAGKLNAAVRQYETCVEILRNELQSTPSKELISLGQSLKEVRDPSPEDVNAATPVREPVESLTPLRGRKSELTELNRLLCDDTVRLVTVTGPGGVGKTRLALQVAAELKSEHGHSVHLVYLAGITDHRMVLPAIAQTLNIDLSCGQALSHAIQHLLSGQQTLLVLDNFEQIKAAINDVTALLVKCPNLKVMLTSREITQVRCEYRFHLKPLAYPDSSLNGQAHVDWAKYPAIQLFTDRLNTIRRNPQLTHDDLKEIGQICQYLDGLPLALELAAARTNVLPLTDLRKQLHGMGSTTDILAHEYADLPERHQSLHAALHWSYRLLPLEEQDLLDRLSVFRGTFMLSDVGALHAKTGRSDVDPVRLFGSLIDKSLVIQDRCTPLGYTFRLLAPIREFAHEQLVFAGEGDRVHDHHAHIYVHLGEEANAHLHGREQRTWLQRIEIEHDNFLAALQWLHENNEADAGLRLCVGLWRYWAKRPYAAEGMAWFSRFLTSDAVDRSSSLGAEAFGCAAVLAHHAGNLSRSHYWITHSVQMAQKLQDDRILANFMGFYGNILAWTGNKDAGIAVQQEALALCRRYGDPWATGATLNNLALFALIDGDYCQAVSLSSEALFLFRTIGDEWGIVGSLANLGNANRGQKRFDCAQTYLEESLQRAQSVSNHRQIARGYGDLALLAHDQGDFEQALTHFRKGLSFCHELGYPMGAVELLTKASTVLCERELLQEAVVVVSAAKASVERHGLLLSKQDSETLNDVIHQCEQKLSQHALRTHAAVGAKIDDDQLFDLLNGRDA